MSPIHGKRAAKAHCGPAAGMLAAAAAFYLRQDFVHRGIFRERLAEGCIEALQQFGHGLIVATHEGDANFLAFGGQHCSPNRQYLTDRDLTARVVEEGLDMFEGHAG